MEDLNEVWVLSWDYNDCAGSGVLRVYADHGRGQMDLELLEAETEVTHKRYTLVQLPLTT